MRIRCKSGQLHTRNTDAQVSIIEHERLVDDGTPPLGIETHLIVCDETDHTDVTGNTRRPSIAVADRRYVEQVEGTGVHVEAACRLRQTTSEHLVPFERN